MIIHLAIIKDPLRRELQKLQRNLDALERKFEARSKVLKEHKEDKKLEKTNKDFEIKRETILAEMNIIEKEIKQKLIQRQISDDIQHKRDWEKVKLELTKYPDKEFREFIKQFAKACVKQGAGVMPLDKLFFNVELPDDIIRKSILRIQNSDYGEICGINARYNFVTTRFAQELSELG